MVTRRRSVQSSAVLRPRPRRVLSAFLKLRREAGKPVEVFDAAHMKRMLWSGKPDDAHCYLERFLPVSAEDSGQSSSELLAHVGVFKTLSKVVSGGEEGARIASLFANPGDYWLENPASVALHKMIAIIHADRTRASMLWKKLKPEGLDRIMDLIARCPELQGKVQLRRKSPLLWDATPHGLRQCPSRFRQTTNCTPSDVLIRMFLRKRLVSVKGKNHSACSGNASSQSAVAHMKVGHIAPQPTILKTPGADTTVSPGVLGNGKLGSEAEDASKAGILGGDGSEAEYASKSKKRKMSAMLEKRDADASTRQ